MVDATLKKIFICRLRARKEVFGNAAAEVASIRARKEFVHQYGGISVHGKRRLTGDNALPRVVIGHRCQTGNGGIGSDARSKKFFASSAELR